MGIKENPEVGETGHYMIYLLEDRYRSGKRGLGRQRMTAAGYAEYRRPAGTWYSSVQWAKRHAKEISIEPGHGRA